MTAFHQETVDASESISAWFAEMLSGLTLLSHDCEKELRGALGRKTVLTDKHLRAIRPAASAFLNRHNTPEAAGIVLSPGVVSDGGSIEWWRRADQGSTNRIVFNLTPDAVGFYDFVTLDWFASVVATGRPALQGPYLDYAGMDQYILTCMVPLMLNGELIGTAGCDTEVSALETVVMPILRTISADAALVSKMDRIVMGNSGRFLVGNRVGDLPADSLRIDLPGVDLGLQLVAVPKNSF
jgi:hypothetical protein